jgi:hypothetical protein
MICETSADGAAPAERLPVSFASQKIFERQAVFQPRHTEAWEFRW